MTEAALPILIVEDEPRLAQLQADYLRAAGYAPRTVDDGAQALGQLTAPGSTPPALMVLDLMLPGLDGVALCRAVRAAPPPLNRLPIIMVTARVEEVDRLLGLEVGADDYLCKPFSPRELVARVKTILRRAPPAGWDAPDGAPPQAPGVTGGPPPAAAGVVLDLAAHSARAAGQALDLTPAEFRLLAALVEQPGRVFSRDQLLDRLHDDQRALSDRTVDSHIKNLRRKLDAHWPGQDLIRSIYGVGYKYEPPV
ncbi:winged helix-turn-helix domain-containing protein [Ideonella livida]|uniref:Response regulator n=1 Tax=Ideonella livida TaxID=2707176 RepID=A0A7C9PFI4_9BURK|nr:winged helix-turn-helix domain-containing protein [Ideonella livida]NDY90389.1 response regulator [Ideonella livida]